jgi:5-methylcytosine-specific restriction endonuclease McrA
VNARLLAHLAEVGERRLHLKQAKSSMFEYCLELGMSEDEAGRRLCAASVAKRFPAVYRMLDEGKLCLSVICKLKHYLTDENHQDLIEGVSGMSYRQAEVWLAARFPQPDAPSSVRKLPGRPPPASAVATVQSTPNSSLETAEVNVNTGSAEPAPLADPGVNTDSVGGESALVSEPVSVDATAEPAVPKPAEAGTPEPPQTSGGDREARPVRGTQQPEDRGRIQPLAADRYRVQFTASSALKEKLELARDLMAHRNPSRDFAPVVEQALDLLIAELQKQRFAQTSRPRRATAPRKNDRVTNATKRAVFERDGLQCSFVDEQGRRCTARAFLERDHRRPRAKGGGSGADNIRHLCRSHNQFAAEIEFGRDHIERAKNAARARRKVSNAATSRRDPMLPRAVAEGAEVDTS